MNLTIRSLLIATLAATTVLLITFAGVRIRIQRQTAQAANWAREVEKLSLGVLTNGNFGFAQMDAGTAQTFAMDSGYAYTFTIGPGGCNGCTGFISTAPTTYYVDCDAGSDSNDCLTTGTPCYTLQAARAKIPKLVQHFYTVQEISGGLCQAGAYISGFSFDPTIVNADAGPGVSFVGTMKQASLGGLMTGAIATATAGVGPGLGNSGPVNWSVVTVIDAGWTTNALRGSEFCITNGPTSPQCPQVYANTDHTATIAGVWPISAPSYDAGFQIQTWATAIDGGLARPPGAAGRHGYSSTSQFPAAFYVHGNSGFSFRSGYSSGYINDTGGQSPFGNVSYSEPPISISGFYFGNSDTLTSVAVTGPQFASVSNNRFNKGVAVETIGGAVVEIVSNYSLQDSFGDQMYWLGNYTNSDVNLANAAASGSGFLFGFGNVCDEVGSGGFSFCFLINGSAVLMQNDMVETSAHTENGAAAGGADAVIVSIGNHYSGMSNGIGFATGASKAKVYSEADEFDTCTDAIEETDESAVFLQGTAPTGTNNSVGIAVLEGSVAHLHNISVNGLGDAGDLNVDGNLYPYLFFIDAGPHVLKNDGTGARITE